MGETGEIKPQRVREVQGSGRWLLRLVLLLLLGIIIYGVATVVLRGRDWSAAENQNNYRELQVLGRALEAWPKSVETMARGNLLPDLLTIPPDGKAARNGWQATAQLDHPELGKVYIHYELDEAWDESCQGGLFTNDMELRNTARVINGSKLSFFGEVPLNTIWDSDMALAGRSSANTSFQKAYIKPLLAALTTQNEVVDAARRAEPAMRPELKLSKRPWPKPCLSMTFQAQIPLAELANLEANAPAFAAVLVVNPMGKTQAIIGGNDIPIASTDEFVLPDSEARTALRELLQSVSKTEVATPAADAEQLANYRAQKAGKPFPISVAGEDYIAYARPLVFPADWSFRDCIPEKPKTRTSTTGSLAGVPFKSNEISDAAQTESRPNAESPASAHRSPQAGIAPQKDTCMLIGLVKARDIESRSLSLASDELALLALLLTLAIVLVPVLKLYLLGPGGYLSAIEVVATLFGLVAATALATLAVLVLINLQIVHARNQSAVERSARAMAAQVEKELWHALRGNYWVPPITYSDPATVRPAYYRTAKASEQPRLVPIASVRLAAGLKCTFPDGEKAGFYVSGVHAGDGPELLKVDGLQDGTKFWPAWEIMAAFGEIGRGFPGYATVANRCPTGNRGEISQRDYFKRAMRGESDGALPEGSGLYMKDMRFSNQRYVIDAVRTQGDGVIKVIAAAKIEAMPGATVDGPRQGVIFRTMALRSLMAPVLPRGQKFIVVDASKSKLPYVFGSAEHRIGIDQLGDAFSSYTASRAIEAAARNARQDVRDGKLPEPQSFTALFEGSDQQFVAQGLPGTPWVLLVHRPLDEIDTGLAKALALAAAAWFFLTLAAGLVLMLFWLKFRRDHWISLWPRPGGGPKALAAARWIGRMAMLALALLGLAWWFAWGPIALIAVLLPLLALIVAWAQLRGEPQTIAGDGTGNKSRFASVMDWLKSQFVRSIPTTNENLKPGDERAYAWLIAALMLAIGAVPMAALWADALATTQEQEAENEVQHLEKAWHHNRETVTRQIRMLGLWDHKPDPEVVVPMLENLGTTGLRTGLPEAPLNTREATQQPRWFEQGLITDQMQEWADLGSVTGAPGCEPAAGTAAPSSDDGSFCVNAAGQVGLYRHAGWAGLSSGTMSAPGWVATGFAIIMLVYLLFLARRTVLRGLFGFGTPLEAVTYPGIGRNEGDKLDLPERAVVLNGPLALGIELLENEDPLDLGNTGNEVNPATHPRLLHYLRLIRSGGTVVATGLDVALKDPVARLLALAALEELSEEIDKAQRHDHPKGKLIVLTDLSPLDRILQAYERERDADASHAPPISRSEQLRWSRLFEDFSTITMRPVTKYALNKEDMNTFNGKLAEKRAELAKQPDKLADDLNDEGITTLIEELQRLPEAAIDSLLEPSKDWDWSRWIKSGKRSYPLETTDYSTIYFLRVIAWAMKVNPVTRAAAIDFLRGALIEHYQHVWAASSHSERLILDNLARGRMVNIRSALAIRSLIRRGIVVLDPMPRLMNESLAAFVRQAERPETIVHWRTELPRSGWDKVARPLALIVPLLTIGLVALAAMYGEGIETILPVILGTGPALITTMFGLRRNP